MFEDKKSRKGIKVEYSQTEEKDIITLTLISPKPLTDDQIFDIYTDYLIVCFESDMNIVRH